MVELKFQQVDVFTSVPFKGNPVLIVYDADELADEKLQEIANWTNLSETVFMYKSKGSADYRLRIFTPAEELSFAGHPTVGSFFAFKQKSGIDDRLNFIQECGAGLVDLEYADDKYFFKLQKFEIKSFSTNQIDDLYTLMGVESQMLANPLKLIDVGPKWLIIQVTSDQLSLNLKPDLNKLSEYSSKYGITGCCCFGEISTNLYETRTFAPLTGVNEDPVCGSGAAAIGVYLHSLNQDKETKFTLKQGRKLLRDGEIQVCADDDSVKVGGSAVLVIDGTITV